MRGTDCIVLAVLAAVRLLLGVCPEMSPQVIRARERTAAGVALEGLLSRVPTSVSASSQMLID